MIKTRLLNGKEKTMEKLIRKADVNCLLGNWPFRKLYKNSFDDLKKVHTDNGISWGCVSSLNSIFYNDPFEGDEELHEIIKDTAYEHILTVNPCLPGFSKDIENGLARFAIKGVRVYPGYHRYKLNDLQFLELCRILREYKLPLFLSLRMEDERLDYLLQPSILESQDIAEFLKSNTENTVLLLNARNWELMNLRDMINNQDSVFCDTSGLKDGLFPVENILKHIHPDKILYGSLYPLYCMESTNLIVEKAEISNQIKEDIFGNNIKQFLYQ